jgi:hypothetical protein
MDSDRNNHNEAHPVANHKDAHKPLIVASITIGLIVLMSILLFSSGNFAGKATGTNNDCGTNFTCFMESAKDCIPVVYSNTFSLDFLGFNITSTEDSEVFEILAEKCIIKQTVTEINLQFTEATKKKLLDSGATPEEIEAQEALSSEYAQEQIGTEINCQYPLNKLDEVLSKWQDGNFSTDDPLNQYCDGFTGEILITNYSIAINTTGEVTLSCNDPDLNDTSKKGTITGQELDLTSGSVENKLVSKEDSCYDSSKVIEYVCNENDFVDWELKTCPEKTICLEGACVLAPPLLNAEDVSKTTTKLLAIENVDKPFWVITTLLDEDGTIILFSKILYPSLEKEQPYEHIVSYPDLDLVKTKKVVVFDVNDPSLWTVYLNETFEVQYEGLS